MTSTSVLSASTSIDLSVSSCVCWDACNTIQYPFGTIQSNTDQQRTRILGRLTRYTSRSPPHLTSDMRYTPNTSQSRFFNPSANLLMDHMDDTCTTPESSPMVSVLTIVCASFFFFFRTCCPPLWNFDLAGYLRTNCWPVGTLYTSSPNLSSNTKDERSSKWKTTFACWRWILWYGRHGTQTRSKFLIFRS
jgi:hypothetical protein